MKRSSNRWATMILNSEDTKKLCYRGVTFVPAEDFISM